MTSPSPRSPDRSSWLGVARSVVRTLGSAVTAAVLMSAALVAMILGVTIDHHFGLDVAQFAVYHSWWFAGLLGLIGLNVAAAALVRFPWRRRHLGFLLVHLGVVVLLFGAWLDFRRGIEGHITLFEGETGSTVIQSRPRFVVRVEGDDAAIDVPFEPGPFNWRDYRGHGGLPWGPWHLAHRDQGVLLDRDGIQVELLDYLADSRPEAVPRLTLGVWTDETAKASSAELPPAAEWKKLTFSAGAMRAPHGGHAKIIFGQHRPLDLDTSLSFHVALDAAEAAAFSTGVPKGSLGRLGQIVLCVEGKPLRFQLDDLLGKPPVALGDSGLTVEVVHFEPVSLAVRLKIERKAANGKDKSAADAPGVMLLSAIRPSVNQPDRRHAVSGSYWFDGSQKPDEALTKDLPEETLRAAAGRRIDVLHTPDGKLLLRPWDGSAWSGKSALPKPVELPSKGSKVAAFKNSKRPVWLFVEALDSSPEPTIAMRPKAFRPEVATSPAARVRLTVDGRAEEFWLTHRGRDQAPGETASRTVAGGRRRVTIEMDDQQFDLGFQIALREATRRLDPGTSRAAHYFSLVDFLDKSPDAAALQKDVLIEINRPVAAVEPGSGRTFRVFQSNYEGPYPAGSEVFQQRVGGRRACDELAGSTFSVSHNPGRAWLYAGFLTVIGGIVVMFYLKH